MRIVVFVGGRSNQGRLTQLVGHLIRSKHMLCCIGACGLHDSPELSVNIDFWVDGDLLRNTPASRALTISNIVTQVTPYLNNDSFELAICHGDRYETLGFAIAARCCNIPIMHMEAGELSGLIDNDVRYAISALSTYLMAPTENALNRLQKSFPHKKNYFVGSPVVDDIDARRLNYQYAKKYTYRQDLIYKIVVLFNPTSPDEFTTFYNTLAPLFGQYVIIWVVPNQDPGNDQIKGRLKRLVQKGLIELLEDLSTEAYLLLLNEAKCLIGNSSSGIKECAVLGVPFLMYGDRQINRDMGTNVYPISERSDLANIIPELPLGRIQYNGEFGVGNTCESVADIISKCDISKMH